MKATSENAKADKSKAELLSASTIAKLLGIDRSTWWRWCAAGIAPEPTIKRGRCVRWARNSIEAFIAGKEATQ